MYFRASNIMFAPIASNGMDTETALPTYGTAVKIGSLNRISDNIDRVEASGYGDNARKVHVDEFRSYGLDVEITHIPRATYASLNGASVDTSSKDITFKDNDQAPYGGLVCVRAAATTTTRTSTSACTIPSSSQPCRERTSAPRVRTLRLSPKSSTLRALRARTMFGARSRTNSRPRPKR